MNWTSIFIKNIITMCLLVILLVNIVFAFDLFQIFPLDTGVIRESGFFNDKYFGVSTILESWTKFFENNDYLNGFTDFLANIRKAQNFVSFKTAFDSLETLSGSGFQVSNNTIGDTILNILGVVIQIVNLLINIPYIVLAIAYLFFYSIYLFSLLFIAIAYIVGLLGGQFFGLLRTIDYPDVDDLVNSVTIVSFIG